MIVLSAGMQKAGTAWYFNLTNEMLIASGHADAREIRRRFHLQRVMTAANCNVGRLGPVTIAAVCLPHLFGRTFVVKTHEAPTAWTRALTRAGAMKVTYIYRDPRDVAVSAYEHGKRIRESGARSATRFDELETIELALDFAGEKLDTWRAWNETPGVLVAKYEALMDDPEMECERVAAFLGLSLSGEGIRSIVERYSTAGARAGVAPHPLHFNRGVTGRWREALSAEQKRAFWDRYGDVIRAMGYPLEG